MWEKWPFSGVSAGAASQELVAGLAIARVFCDCSSSSFLNCFELFALIILQKKRFSQRCMSSANTFHTNFIELLVVVVIRLVCNNQKLREGLVSAAASSGVA